MPAASAPLALMVKRRIASMLYVCMLPLATNKAILRLVARDNEQSSIRSLKIVLIKSPIVDLLQDL